MAFGDLYLRKLEEELRKPGFGSIGDDPIPARFLPPTPEPESLTPIEEERFTALFAGTAAETPVASYEGAPLLGPPTPDPTPDPTPPPEIQIPAPEPPPSPGIVGPTQAEVPFYLEREGPPEIPLASQQQLYERQQAELRAEEEPDLRTPFALNEADKIWKAWREDPQNNRAPTEAEMQHVSILEATRSARDDPKAARINTGVRRAQEVAVDILGKFPGDLAEDMDPTLAGTQAWILSKPKWKENIALGVWHDVVGDLTDDGDLPQNPTPKQLREWRIAHPGEFDELRDAKYEYYWQRVLATAHRGFFVETDPLATQDIIEGKGSWLPEWIAKTAPVVAARAAFAAPHYTEVATKRQISQSKAIIRFFTAAAVPTNMLAAVVREVEIAEKNGEDLLNPDRPGFMNAVKDAFGTAMSPIDSWNQVSEIMRSEGAINYLRTGGELFDSFPYLVDSLAENMTDAFGVDEHVSHYIARVAMPALIVGAIVVEPEVIVGPALALGGVGFRIMTRAATLSKLGRTAKTIDALNDGISQGQKTVDEIFDELPYSTRDLLRAEVGAGLRSRRPSNLGPGERVMPGMEPGGAPEAFVEGVLKKEDEILEGLQKAEQQVEKELSRAERHKKGLERAVKEEGGDIEIAEAANKADLEKKAVAEANAKAEWEAIHRPGLPKDLRGTSPSQPAASIADGTFIKNKKRVEREIGKLQKDLSNVEKKFDAAMGPHKKAETPTLKEALHAVKQLDEGSALNKQISNLKAALKRPRLDSITDAQWAVFVSKGDVPDDIIEVVAMRVRNQSPLSLREKAIYRDKISEINKKLLDMAAGKVPGGGKTKKVLREELEGLKQQRWAYGKVKKDYRVEMERLRSIATRGDDDALKVLGKRRKKLQRQIAEQNMLLTKGTSVTGGLGLHALAKASQVFRAMLKSQDDLAGAIKLMEKDIGPVNIPYTKARGYSPGHFDEMMKSEIDAELARLAEEASNAQEILNDLGAAPEFIKSVRDIVQEALTKTAKSYRQMQQEAKGLLPKVGPLNLFAHLSNLTDETATTNKGSLLQAIREDEYLQKALDTTEEGSLLKAWAEEPVTTTTPLVDDVSIVDLQAEIDALSVRAFSERNKALGLSRAEAGMRVLLEDPTSRKEGLGVAVASMYRRILNAFDPAYSQTGPFSKGMFEVQRTGQNTLAQAGKELSEVVDFARYNAKGLNPIRAARKAIFSLFDTNSPVEMTGGAFSILNRLGNGTIWQTGSIHLAHDMSLRAGALDKLDEVLTLLEDAVGTKLSYADVVDPSTGKVLSTDALRGRLKSKYGVKISSDQADTVLHAVGNIKVADVDSIPLALRGLSRMWIGSEEIPPAITQMQLIRAARRLVGENLSFQKFSEEMKKVTDTVMPGRVETSEIRALSFGANAISISYAKDAAAQTAMRVLGGRITTTEARSANAIMTGEFLGEGVDFEAGIAALNKMGAPLTLTSWTSGVKRLAEHSRELTSIATKNGGTAWLPKVILDSIESEADRIIKEIDRRSMPSPMGEYARNAIQAWKTSLVTGLYLPNPRYWVNNIAGDHSQIWVEEGLLDASRLSFQNLIWNVPLVQRRLSAIEDSMRQSIARLPGGAGRDFLGTITNAVFNPHVNDLLRHGEGTLISRTGERIPKSQLRRELIEENITDTFVQEEVLTHWTRQLERSFEANREAPPDFFTDKIEALSQWSDKWSKDLSYHAASVQQRQRIGLYSDLRMKGTSREEAARRTLNALYDWKHGAAHWEMNGYFRYIPFARFWRNAVKQANSAFLEPFTLPAKEVIWKGLKGDTKIARIKQQAIIMAGFPDIFNAEDPDEVSRQSEMVDIASARLPSWADSRPTTSAKMAPTWIKDFYALSQGGRRITHGFRTMPPATPLDAMEISFAGAMFIAQGVSMGAMGERLAPGWERSVWEPALATVFPYQRETLSAFLEAVGQETGGARAGSMMILQPKYSRLFRKIPGLEQYVQLGDDGRERIPTLLGNALALPLAGVAYGPVSGIVREGIKKVPVVKALYPLADPKSVFRMISFMQNQYPTMYKNIWGDNPHRWKEHEDWIKFAGFAASRTFAIGSLYYFNAPGEWERPQREAREVSNEIGRELLGEAGARGTLKRGPDIQPRYEWESKPGY